MAPIALLLLIATKAPTFTILENLALNLNLYETKLNKFCSIASK